ncbi:MULTISPECIES: hypothetical protein [Streptomyces]|uniref:Uncharacterized protein n=1 Tax=Streptomyces viridochromogenes TaxID=1938 RepID=A0A0L8JA25_STRVR|nr:MULTISPECIES: hypothetical protein [Streptomyces]KOG10379.1 hypothetical protein ADK34_35335 [Streptomyces viridochromogenes]
MTRGPSRRAALLAAVGSALALPAIGAGTARASGPSPKSDKNPFVTHPRQSGAIYSSAAARNAHAEPLNAAVECAVGRGGGS